ncbi:MAG TPA: N-acetylmuramoyl-L-alanine amidase [Scandinavium sp.]|jgi:N-acetylmuramoyl-L-alanine amidase|uniref:N-acetylmuramoyl-L-alanine amidase n=1 Tax=Scandinavium sp. TaxID=2830653 RepID=UPI002E329A10|nr:N-acetylmuramoyl-L-alanine amidase [Scandinavium sp.]HEX4500588.1 N-acetylmuramoyl-L-alanine amidase [Scandinavium sp.]
MKIVISSGHGLKVRGASGFIDEVDEARKVVARVATDLEAIGVGVVEFHDDVSTTQSQNLNRIVAFHNSQTRDLDISVHFNANKTTPSPMGCEVLYVTQVGLAGEVASAICAASGLKNRGAKKRTDLFFLNKTEEPAILIEVCFVDSQADVDIYHNKFGVICEAIADSASGQAPPLDTRWREDITATVFGGKGDPQDSAYTGKPVDPTVPAVALPYKWYDEPAPTVIVEGPKGASKASIVDRGPWNLDDEGYVIKGFRPAVEGQYENQTEAENGQVPTNDAGIDLTPALADKIGISGKGKVKWRFA